MYKDGLHYHNTKNHHSTLVQTTIENEARYRESQLKSAKLVREIYAKVGYPYQKDWKNWIRYNIISNCSVTLEDSIKSKKIYGTKID